MEVKQYDIVLVNLEPTVGHEIRKTRPCVVISPNEMNQNLQTIIIAPLTSKSKHYPTRVELKNKYANGWIVLDQIRTIDRKRIVKPIGFISTKEIEQVQGILREMLMC